MESARNNAMVSVTNEVVFTELDTLVMVAREAIRKVVGISARFAEEARDRTYEWDLRMGNRHRVEPHPGRAQMGPPDGCKRLGVAPEDEHWCPMIPETGNGVVKHPLDNVSLITRQDWKWGDVEY